jgi:cytoskeleton protein RodZ
VQVTPDGKTAIKVESPEKVEVNDTLTTNKVSMTFSEQTWVRVTNKSGKVIFEKTLPAGAADGFDGEPPFNVVIGNAVATKLMYSGKQIDLASSTKSNVARLTLE